MKSKFKKERKEHNTLMDLLKSHFMKDENEILNEEEQEISRGKSFKRNPGRDRVDEEGNYFNPKSSYEGDEEDSDEDEDYFDEDVESPEEEEDEEEENARMPKDKRKSLAIVLLTKKLGKHS